MYSLKSKSKQKTKNKICEMMNALTNTRMDPFMHYMYVKLTV